MPPQLAGFVGAMMAIVGILTLNIALVQKRTPSWKIDCTILFIASMGQSGERHIERIQKICSLDTFSAELFAKYQMLSLIEIISSIIIIFVVVGKMLND